MIVAQHAPTDGNLTISLTDSHNATIQLFDNHFAILITSLSRNCNADKKQQDW